MEVFNKESYAPVLIARKTGRLSKELNRDNLRFCYDDWDAPNTKRGGIQHGFTRLLRMLLLSPVVAIFSTYMALVYGLLCLLITSHHSLYEYISLDT